MVRRIICANAFKSDQKIFKPIKIITIKRMIKIMTERTVVNPENTPNTPNMGMERSEERRVGKECRL